MIDNWNKEKTCVNAKNKKELWEKTKRMAIDKCFYNITIKIITGTKTNKKVYRFIN